jgi:hypothetical protein
MNADDLLHLARKSEDPANAKATSQAPDLITLLRAQDRPHPQTV